MTYDERDFLVALVESLEDNLGVPTSDIYKALVILIRDAVDRSRE